MTNSDEILTRYLFGELSESEQTRLEKRYFTDAQTFQHLAQLETELVDDYARGRLSPEMRDRFERAYLANPHRRARVKFGEALTTKVDEIGTPIISDQPIVEGESWLQRVGSMMKGRMLAFSMAVALLLIVVATAWLWIQNNRLRQELASAHSQQSVQEQQARETQQQLDNERSKSQQLTDELERERTERNLQTPPQNSASTISTLILTVSGVRGAETGAAPKLMIHSETQQVGLQLKLRENEYQSYDILLQQVGGKEVYSRQHVKPSGTKPGASFNITLPVSKVPTGDYILTLKGTTTSGEQEDVSQSLFRVEKD